MDPTVENQLGESIKITNLGKKGFLKLWLTLFAVILGVTVVLVISPLTYYENIRQNVIKNREFNKLVSAETKLNFMFTERLGDLHALIHSPYLHNFTYSDNPHG